MSDRLTYSGQQFAVAAGNGMYEDRVTIKRRVSAKTGLDTTYSRLTIASDVPCRIKPSTAGEKEVAGATQGSTAFTVRMPLLQNQTPIELDSLCLFEIAARGEVEARTLYVVAPLPSPSGVLDAVAIRTS